MAMNFTNTIPEELIPSDPRFGCGPSLIPQQRLYKLADIGPKFMGTSHRQATIKNTVKEIQEGLTKYFGLPAGYKVILGNGGASFFWDMLGLGAVQESVHCYVCGEFSQKCYQAMKNIPWIEATKTEVPFGQGLDVYDQENADLICTVLNETSTGVQITSYPERRKGRLLAIDATSGAGQIPVDFSKIDFYYFSPQKVFASEGGLYIAILSPQAIERVKEVKELKRYIPVIMDFSLALENGEGNQTYTTPSLSGLFFLNEQIKELNVLGEKKVAALAEDKAELIYEWALSCGYAKPFIKEDKFRSRSVATIDIDDAYDATEIAKYLREQGIAVDIDSYRKLGRNQFRISMFHSIKKEDLDKLTQVIDFIVAQNKKA